MRTAMIAIIIAASFHSFAQGADITLYEPDYTPTEAASLGIVSATGDWTLRPVSTAANGQTAYEVQFTATAAALIYPHTTSSMEPNPTPTTFTILADATKLNIAHTLSIGSDGAGAFISEQECIKRDDGNFVCEAKGEFRDATSTDAKYGTYTAPARPWYTIKDISSATSLRFKSEGAAMAMVALAALGLTMGMVCL